MSRRKEKEYGDASLICADCTFTTDSRFRALLHVVASLFSFHLVVREKRCDHWWVSGNGQSHAVCEKCGISGPVLRVEVYR